MEVASGAASMIPGSGTAASLAISSGIAAYDYKYSWNIINAYFSKFIYLYSNPRF